MRSFCILLLVSIGCTVQAATINGKVINVADGDTITVLDASKMQHKIRLAGIDAPEKRQAFGERSRESMARFVAGKEVSADCHKIDRYKRQVCKIWVQPVDCATCGKSLDAGHAQIVAGMAWWYRDYANIHESKFRTIAMVNSELCGRRVFARAKAGRMTFLPCKIIRQFSYLQQ